MKILIVDDSIAQRTMLKTILSSHGECHLEPDGAKGLLAFVQAFDMGKPFDLVVMDIMMPEMDGHTAVKKIVQIMDKSNNPNSKRAKILMLSSRSDPEDMLKAQFENKADSYLIKPVNQATLTEALCNLGLISSPCKEYLD